MGIGFESIPKLEADTSKFKKGDVVYYKSNTNMTGLIIRTHVNEDYYLVRFSFNPQNNCFKGQSIFQLINVYGFEIEKK